jgi:hypothetical protein
VRKRGMRRMMKQSQKMGGWGPRGLWGVVYSEDGKKDGIKKKNDRTVVKEKKK